MSGMFNISFLLLLYFGSPSLSVIIINGLDLFFHLGDELSHLNFGCTLPKRRDLRDWVADIGGLVSFKDTHGLVDLWIEHKCPTDAGEVLAKDA